jgi:hypothetical protein
MAASFQKAQKHQHMLVKFLRSKSKNQRMAENIRAIQLAFSDQKIRTGEHSTEEMRVVNLKKKRDAQKVRLLTILTKFR